MKPMLASVSLTRHPQRVTLDFWVLDHSCFVGWESSEVVWQREKNPHMEDQKGISVDVWAEGGHSREKSDGWMSDLFNFFFPFSFFAFLRRQLV